MRHKTQMRINVAAKRLMDNGFELGRGLVGMSTYMQRSRERIDLPYDDYGMVDGDLVAQIVTAHLVLEAPSA